mmetsp:Transcript_41572/g.132257  ORF Transcript_41572/g.132257 Transcript_41572/m.132257 type:complete len:88 (-) Transcript_41572:44-307(-)
MAASNLLSSVLSCPPATAPHSGEGRPLAFCDTLCGAEGSGCLASSARLHSLEVSESPSDVNENERRPDRLPASEQQLKNEDDSSDCG